jgi:hypothetical protein
MKISYDIVEFAASRDITVPGGRRGYGGADAI